MRRRDFLCTASGLLVPAAAGAQILGPIMGAPAFPAAGLVAAWEPFRQVNVLRQSGNLADTGFWTRTGLSAVELVPGGGPGGRDAWRVKEDGSNGLHYLQYANVPFTSGQVYLLSEKVKPSERSNVILQFNSGPFGALAFSVRFDVSAGTATIVSGTPSYGITPLSDGYYLCWIYGTAVATQTANILVALYSGAVSYQGDNASSLLIAEPQLEQALPGQTAPSPYVPTDALQLLNQSPRWKRGAWQAKRGSTDGVDTNDFAVESRRWVFDGGDNYADLQTEDFGGQCSLFAGPGEAWTVAVVASAADGVDQTLVSRGGGAAPTRTFSLFKSVGAGNKIGAIVNGTSNTFGVVDTLTHIHIVTWDGATAKYYLDGNDPVTLNVGAAAEETGQRIILGARTNGTAVYLNGSMPAAYFWSRALTPAEVARLRLRYLKPQLASVGVTIP